MVILNSYINLPECNHPIHGQRKQSNSIWHPAKRQAESVDFGSHRCAKGKGPEGVIPSACPPIPKICATKTHQNPRFMENHPKYLVKYGLITFSTPPQNMLNHYDKPPCWWRFFTKVPVEALDVVTHGHVHLAYTFSGEAKAGEQLGDWTPLEEYLVGGFNPSKKY